MRKLKKINKKSASTKRIWFMVFSLCLAFYLVAVPVFIFFTANSNLNEVQSVYSNGVNNIIFPDMSDSNQGADINQGANIYSNMIKMKNENKSEDRIISTTREALQDNIFNLSYYNNIYSYISLYYGDKTYSAQGDKPQLTGVEFDDDAYVSSDVEYWMECHVNSTTSGVRVYSDGTKVTDNIFILEVPLKMENLHSGAYNDLISDKLAGCVIEGYYKLGSTEYSYMYNDGSYTAVVNEIIPTSIRFTKSAVAFDSDGKTILDKDAVALTFNFPENIIEGEPVQVFGAAMYKSSLNYSDEDFAACSESMGTYLKNAADAGRNYTISENGFTTKEWIDGDTADGWLQLVKKTTITFGAYIGEWNSRDIYYVVSARSYPLKTAISDLTEIILIGLAADIAVAFAVSFFVSYKRKKEQQFELSRKNLTDAAAHELKTPLGIIRNHGEAISAGVNPEKTDEYIDVIIKETERLDKLVLDMLDISRLDADVYIIKNEKFSLTDLTVSLLERFAPLVKVKNFDVSLDAQEDYMIVADENAIKQVAANFISNAIKHTTENGKIKIKIANTNFKTRFSIENEGEHIPEDQIKRIWDLFYKTIESKARETDSTGLGLAIAKKYLQLHKAGYGCENIETGVRFWFEI